MTRAPRIAIVALRDSHECTLDIGFRASVKDLCLLSDLVTVGSDPVTERSNHVDLTADHFQPFEIMLMVQWVTAKFGKG